ncbi:ABC transporter ATP-binding protein [Croceicoccus naphthovorans]|uniref:Ferrichrome ABC transporter ATP-binding protein n=1 Tax=Croceicoccus naphthovorans TaxID=1348774 RepID=A0A0G3XG72_9SPHN|nr:ATP-binding cassette domain-containing protein [Croceicoccus naphthovorans]AKM09626.1 ferrichrome ABC transporter ATP-binding protein [Croceicoccus naphthovorans]MBB3989596.1 iron complex transport system ATP-binding protein [Croceicoccus naphthovorans]
MLAANDLSIRRGRRMVVEGATLAIEPGKLTAICGPNGAGKSSLLSALAGLLPEESGTAELDGRAIAAIPPRERARTLGYLPQQADVAWDISVETLVGLGRLPWRSVPGRPAWATREADAAAVAEAIHAMELEQLAHRPVSQLSGGEKARAAMARVLAGDPRWMLADEPLASLDLAHQRRLIRQLRAEAERGRGVVVVLHDLAAAMNHADRVVVLDRGRIAADGPPDKALAPDLIARVWQVEVSWTGSPGERALIVI